MNFSLSDLVPPLRWSDASTITLLTGQPELPDAWWRALPMTHVLAAIGPEPLGDLLAEIALTHWPAAAVGDLLPALHVLDPEEADEPHVAIALDRAGSWAGLLALTGRELADQPFVQARPVLGALFRAVLARLTPGRPAVAEAGAQSEPAAVAESQAEQAAEAEAAPPEPVVAAEAEPAPPKPVAEDPEPVVAAQPEAVAEAEPAEPEPIAEPAPVVEFQAEPAAAPQPVAVPQPVAAVKDWRPLHDLVEGAFAGLDDMTWAVAQNRVFTDAPSQIEQLAKLFAVPASDLRAIERDLRARLAEWLAAAETAAFREHLDELRARLGASPSAERLATAAEWHRQEVRPLEVPVWHFVLAALQTDPSAAPPIGDEPADQPAPNHFEAHDQREREAARRTPNPAEDLPPAPAEAAFAAAAPQFPQAQAQQAKPLKDVSHTKRCFRQPDGRWWLRVDVTAELLNGGECPLPSGFAAYLGLSPGERRTVRSAAGELALSWHTRPTLESVGPLLRDVGAQEGGHLFLTLSDEGVLRARHLPVAAGGSDPITRALRLVGYTAPGGTLEQAARVIATRIGMTGPVSLPDLKTRLRERGDRDLLDLLD